MMILRCPNCQSEHEVDASVLLGKSRRVRCAVCRTVFEAAAPDSLTPQTDPELDWPDEINDVATPAPEPVAMADAETEMAVDDIDALFDAPDPAPSPPSPPPALDDALAAPIVASAAPPTDDPFALDAAQGAAIAAGAAAAGAALTASPVESEAPRKRNPHSNPKKSKAKPRFGPAIGLVAATGFGTLLALAVFRHEVVRIAPGFAPAFEAVGLDVNSTGLEILTVRSRVLREDHHEFLEVTGEITNITRARQPVPMLRLSLHNGEGQQIYVWSGMAERPELGPGEKTSFRRRLANPPREAEQVMVRFVARDDIVASIR
jgi:predicted Zn finger-like uncharacterized protein